MHFAICFIFVLSLPHLASGNHEIYKGDENLNTTVTAWPQSITFYVKEPFKVLEATTHVISWSSSSRGVKHVNVSVEDEDISVILSHNETLYPSPSNITEYIYNSTTVEKAVTVEGWVNMSAKFIGFNKMFVVLLGDNDEILANGTLEVGVMLVAHHLTKVYEICITVIVVSVYTNMGANLDLELVKRIIREPVGPAIGLFCQYVCMPVIAFSLGLVFFPNEPLFHLGLFASGCSPGGGLSNMWTYLLGGSLDLSVMMTFTSTVASLGTIPLWLLTLGRVIIKDADFVIPYTNVLIGIVLLIVPCFVGILIQLKLPRVTKIMKMLLTPLSLFNILFILSFGVLANLYLFSYMTWKAIGAGLGQSLLGYAAGFVIAFLCRRSVKEMITISIETAVQNNNVAFLLLKMSLEKPAGDLAVCCVGLFTLIPLLVVLMIKITYRKIYLRVVKDSQKSQTLENVELRPTKPSLEEASKRESEEKEDDRNEDHIEEP